MMMLWAQVIFEGADGEVVLLRRLEAHVLKSSSDIEVRSKVKVIGGREEELW